MPRNCTICAHEAREKIDRELVSGASIRGIARKFRVSEDSLFRHKTHVSQSLLRGAERCEERHEENLFVEIKRVQQKSWELLSKMEAEGDHRGSIVALREIRECIESLGGMLMRVAESGGLAAFTDAELEAEVKRRGLGTLMRVEILNVGGQHSASV